MALIRIPVPKKSAKRKRNALLIFKKRFLMELGSAEGLSVLVRKRIRIK